MIELGDDLLTAIALPRVHDQVVPNTTFVEHWSAGAATFFFPEDEIQVQKKGQGHIWTFRPPELLTVMQHVVGYAQQMMASSSNIAAMH